MFREATFAAVALAGHMAAAYKLENRDGAAHGAHGAHGGGHDHSHDHAASASSASGYAAPATGYEEPSTSYGAVSSGYGATAAEPALPDLTPIIIGILVLTGLSLLFPTYVSLATVRRKRDVDGVEESSPMNDVLERVNDIYSAVVESEECMERIACEVGGLASDFGLTQSPASKVSLVDDFVPSKYKTYYKQFKSGQNCDKIKCGSIF